MLRGTAGAILVGAAGCLGTGGSDDSQPTSTAAEAAPSRTPSRAPAPTPGPTRTPSPTATRTALYDPAARIYFRDEDRLPGNGVGVEAYRLGGADAIKAYFRDEDGHVRWCLLYDRFDGASFYYDEAGLFIRSRPEDATWGGDSWTHVKWPRGESPTRTVAAYAVFDGVERHLTTETDRV